MRSNHHLLELLELLGIRHPILLAPMAGATNAAMVAGVSNAGGLGGLGAAHMPGARLRESIESIREKTDAPFNVNLFSGASLKTEAAKLGAPEVREKFEGYHRELGLGPLPEVGPVFGPTREQLALLVELRVPVISFHFGVSQEEVEEAKSGRARVPSTATTAAEAVALEACGVDAIIAQGSEAGGHRGTHRADDDPRIGTMELVPQVVAAVSLPVIASGGVMNAQGIADCLSLGAAGVQLGTAFLACEESPISPMWRRELRSATAASTTLTRAFSGRVARSLANRFSQEMAAVAGETLPFPAQYSLGRRLWAAAREGANRDFSPMWAGQGVALLQELPIAELMRELCKGVPQDD